VLNNKWDQVIDIRRPLMQRRKHTFLSILRVKQPKWININRKTLIELFEENVPLYVFNALQTKKVKQVPDFLKIWNNNNDDRSKILYIV
jgi:hypothetical protein